jgi:ribonuclease P protein component
MAAVASPRDRRLRAGWQFREVYRTGESIHGSLMTLISLGKGRDHGRTAYVASRKVGHAVRRNRAKRLLREGFRKLPAARRDESRWRIWIARAACSRSTAALVWAEMERLVGRESRES